MTDKKLKQSSSLINVSGAKCNPCSIQGQLDKVAEGKPWGRTEGVAVPLRSGDEKKEVCQTPSRYNGSQFDKSHIIGLDYLELNIIGSLPFLSDEEEFAQGNFTFIHSGKRTKNFEAVFQIYYKNEVFALAQLFPREGNVLDANMQLVKLDNQLFYSEPNLYEAICEYLIEFDLVYQNITRCDVYLDTYGFANGMTLNQLDYLLDNGDIISSTRVKDKAKHSGKVEGVFMTTGFSWGKRASSKYLRIYNKTLELLKSDKQYISEFHKQNGLTKHDVYRFEYQLKNEFFKQIQNFDLEHLFDTQGLFEVLDMARKGHFEFRFEDGQKRNDRKKEVELFNWDQLRCLPQFVYDYVKLRKRHSSETTYSAKRQAAILFKGYITFYQDWKLLRGMFAILNRYDLGEWWGKKESKYKKQYLQSRSVLYEFNETVYINDCDYLQRDYPV